MHHKTRKHNIHKKIHTITKSKKIQNINCNKNLPGYISFETNNEPQNATFNNNELIHFFTSRNSSDAKKLLVNDYYTYMCKPSIEKINVNEIPKYINIINSTTLLQEKIYRQCIEIVELNKNKHKNLNTFYQSAKINISIETAQKHLNKEITFIDNLRLDTVNNNLWKLLAYFNKTSIISSYMPLIYQLNPDEKNNTKFTIYLTNNLVNNYKSLNLDNLDNKKEYTKYVNSMFFDLLGKNNKINVEDIIQVNSDMYDCLSKTNTNYDYTVLYRNNEQKFNFNYEEFFKELGYQNESIPASIVIKDIVYFEKICKLLLDNWNSDKWRSFWIISYAKQIGRFTDKINVYGLNYYVKYNTDSDYTLSNDILAIKLTVLVFNNLLSNLYIEKYNDINGVKYLTNLVNDLKLEFYKIIQNNKWMTPHTKKKSLLNIETLKILIGRTVSVLDDFEITYTGDIWQNIMLYMEQKHNLYLTLYNKNIINIPKILWEKYRFEYSGHNIFTANIIYDDIYNLIYIPSGYIQEPVMDLRSKGLMYNVANIGIDIAKEFNKVIDDNGSQYNYYGMLGNWWTKTDKAKYKLLKQNVINEYLLLAKKDKQQCNITGLENNIISFLNGFYICDSYLQSYYSNIKLPYIITDSKLSSFYSYFANSNKEKIMHIPKVNLNPMLSPKYLVNLALSKNPIFNHKYCIKSGDNMYNENKEIIW